jgi:hypothetical protein
MRADDGDEFAGSDDLGFLPELWEMARIAGDQVVRAGGVGTFEKNIIGGVERDLKRGGWPILAGFARVGLSLVSLRR